MRTVLAVIAAIVGVILLGRGCVEHRPGFAVTGAIVIGGAYVLRRK